MKIPKKIKIGGFIWQIKESQEIANQSNIFGSTHYRQQKIFLEPSETQQKKEQTLFHEVLHVLWWQTGLSSRYNKEGKQEEEEIVDALSHGLYQVLRDNKII